MARPAPPAPGGVAWSPHCEEDEAIRDESSPSGTASRPTAVVVGTRPDVVKLSPVVAALRARRHPTLVVSTGQQEGLARAAMDDVGLAADVDLGLMTADQEPLAFLARVLGRLPEVLGDRPLRGVLVQGDTTTALGAALVGHHLGLPVGHVEAGLRTGDPRHPFPEEGNRRLIGQLADLHLAPTARARRNLRAEGVADEAIVVTGNTAVDALLAALATATLPPASGELLVTLHRRESLGPALDGLVEAVARFVDAEPTGHVVWPLHPNPSVEPRVRARLGAHPRVRLLPPQGHRAFVELLAGARLVLTDSGGVQEEAPSLGKVVLVARERTERPELLEVGGSRLVGRDPATVAPALEAAWALPPYEGLIPAPSPFGDGRAAEAIVDAWERRT